MSTADPDFLFENHGSVWTCQPMNGRAWQHLETQAPEAMWYSGALVLEPRYVDTLAEQLEHDGFTTRT